MWLRKKLISKVQRNPLTKEIILRRTNHYQLFNYTITLSIIRYFILFLTIIGNFRVINIYSSFLTGKFFYLIAHGSFWVISNQAWTICYYSINISSHWNWKSLYLESQTHMVISMKYNQIILSTKNPIKYVSTLLANHIFYVIINVFSTNIAPCFLFYYTTTLFRHDFNVHQQ